ncbi:GNAT family N-acetyltransferase [Mesonia maritima]|uniref:GNAT superfamily N-acetyltransferase n=1 Tax=Mesonia maritima TaxID=1793873 RepID=A0ABU1K6M6_9FLAO|nr:GNAT family N-acetyltransferase [Mesonia maritima]MDR6301260.1 GNAT superfamily N-acetyltransferase [Mesonia maritima]
MKLESIKQVSVEDILPIRQEVLRPGKAVETCFFENDKAEESVHFGYFLDEKIAGIASVLKDSSQEFAEKNQFRLRGMAVLPSYRNYAIGKKLLQHSEKYCIEKNADLLWFNAREKIVPFYKKYAFQIKGSIFEIPTVGPHQLMVKFFK